MSVKRRCFARRADAGRALHDARAGGLGGDRRTELVWLLAFAIFFFLSLALVKRYVELRSSTLVPGERIAGRGYRAEDQEIIAQAGMAAAFSSALVLALYIDSDAVRELYEHPLGDLAAGADQCST